MKKVVYFLLAWMLVGLSACENEPKFKVQGEVSGAEDKVLYFEASSLNGVVVLDSVRLGSDGNFSFWPWGSLENTSERSIWKQKDVRNLLLKKN